MSKIGKQPVSVPNGVTVTVAGQVVTIEGPKGKMTVSIPNRINVAVADTVATVTQEKTGDVTTRALFGLTRAQIANAVKGVNEGFDVKLELVGVGFRAQASGSELTLTIGFSHPVKMTAPAGVQFSTPDNTHVTVSGFDKALVGNTAAKIRAVRPPEPYKGKGIKYVGEYIRKKAGKAAKAVGGK